MLNNDPGNEGVGGTSTKASAFVEKHKSKLVAAVVFAGILVVIALLR